MKGDSIKEQFGIYETQWYPNPSNQPGARTESVSWRDVNGDLWLYGGKGYAANGTNCLLSDLWKYSVALNQWAWVDGNNYGNANTNANAPGGRKGSVSWTDASGHLWLFGGWGYDLTLSSQGYLNDLWEYNGGWTFRGSLQEYYQGNPGTYGTANDKPGCRNNAVSWVDNSGNLWLFGGIGKDGNGSYGYLNDLWKYNPSTHSWTWVKGDNTVNSVSVYGTKGVPSINNKPGGRAYSATWNDAAGNLWLFGGLDNNNKFYQDLWSYNIATNKWTWVNGFSNANGAGSYGIQGVASLSTRPGAREGSATWTDATGNLWLFGGTGYDTYGILDELNDLWKYDPVINQWAWMKGHMYVDQRGIYGTQTVKAPDNEPGGRHSQISWTDGSGNFWLFGGYGYDFSSLGYLGDMWKLEKDDIIWIGNDSTNWTVPSNWSTGIVPGANDNVTIPSGTPYNATVPDGVTVSVRSLRITTGAQVFVGTNAHLNVMH